MQKEQVGFGRLLRQYRMHYGLTQEALAEQARISTRAVSDLERGINRSPRFDTIHALADVLRLSQEQRGELLTVARPSFQQQQETDIVFSDLPHPLTPLVGREQELLDLVQILGQGEARLLTLTGPGGVGKTRLSIQVARQIQNLFSDGVVFVPLVNVTCATLVPVYLAQMLGLREPGTRGWEEYLQDMLRTKQLLLVLDNFEHVLGAAPFLASLLAACPRLCALVSSRACLHLSGEQEFVVAPLPLEDAVTLLRQRSRQRHLEWDQHLEEAALQTICERLDRLPLAIELVATHAKMLSPVLLLKRLSQSLPLLRNGARDLHPRQQTMENAIAWSYQLLNHKQQKLFRAISIFVGGCTLDALRAVFAPEEVADDGLPDVVAALVDQSLLSTVVTVSGEVRFTMLVVLREYALQHLRAAGEEKHYRQLHAVYYADLGEQLTILGPEQAKRMEQLEGEIPNVRAAIEWSYTQQDVKQGLCLAGVASALWFMTGQTQECAAWYQRMLALSPKMQVPLSVFANALFESGRVALRHGHLVIAEDQAHECLRRAEQEHDHVWMSNALMLLGEIAQTQSLLEEAERLFTQAHVEGELGGNRATIGRARFGLIQIARLKGDYATAEAIVEQELPFCRAMNMAWGIANTVTTSGHLALAQQQYERAKHSYHEGLTYYKTFDNKTYIAMSLESIALLAGQEGKYKLAIQLCVVANTLREQELTPRPPVEQPPIDQLLSEAEVLLGSLVFDEYWKDGSVLIYGQAIQLALDYTAPVSS